MDKATFNTIAMVLTVGVIVVLVVLVLMGDEMSTVLLLVGGMSIELLLVDNMVVIVGIVGIVVLTTSLDVISTVETLALRVMINVVPVILGVGVMTTNVLFGTVRVIVPFISDVCMTVVELTAIVVIVVLTAVVVAGIEVFKISLVVALMVIVEFMAAVSLLITVMLSDSIVEDGITNIKVLVLLLFCAAPNSALQLNNKTKRIHTTLFHMMP